MQNTLYSYAIKKVQTLCMFFNYCKMLIPRYLLSRGEMECRLFGFSSHPPIQNKQYINKQNRMKKESEELSRVTKRLISCKRCRWSSPESCDSSAQVTGYNRQARAWSDCGMKEGESPGVSVHSFTLAARGVWKAGVSDPHVCGGAWVTVIASLVSSSVDMGTSPHMTSSTRGFSLTHGHSKSNTHPSQSCFL